MQISKNVQWCIQLHWVDCHHHDRQVSRYWRGPLQELQFSKKDLDFDPLSPTNVNKEIEMSEETIKTWNGGLEWKPVRNPSLSVSFCWNSVSNWIRWSSVRAQVKEEGGGAIVPDDKAARIGEGTVPTITGEERVGGRGCVCVYERDRVCYKPEDCKQQERESQSRWFQVQKFKHNSLCIITSFKRFSTMNNEITFEKIFWSDLC